MKRIVINLVFISLLLTLFPFSSLEIHANELVFDITNYTQFEVNRYVYDTFGNLILPSINYKGFTLKFNVELHKEKNILVYGNAFDVTSIEGKNTFKIVDGGYYPSDSVGTYFGEYRYHGYTADGNLYTSNDFPRDSDSGRTVSEKEWIYNYWHNVGERPSQITLEVTSQYAERDPDLSPVRNAIDDMVNDILKNSTNKSSEPRFKDKEGQGYAVADHMNIMTLNSSLFNGEGKMMQKNAGRLWYQMFSTEKANAKSSKNQHVTVEILNKGEHKIDSNGQATIQVKVVGSYLDSDVMSDADKIVYFHKDEMKGINLKLSLGSKIVNELGRPNTIVNGHTSFEHIFEVVVDEGDIVEGILTARAESYTVFFVPTGEAVNDTAFASDFDTLGGGLKSLFVINDIELEDKALFTKDMIAYKDHSTGDIDSYEIKVINMTSKREKTFNYPRTPNGFIDDLFAFVDIDNEFAVYKILQTVKNDHAEDLYIDSFTFRKEVKQAFELDIDLPLHVIDVDPVEAIDNTDYRGGTVKSKSIKVDGKAVEWDLFFNSGFSFGETHSNYLALIEITVVNDQDVKSVYTDAFNVHSSLPRSKLDIEGSLKENRRVTLFNKSSDVEDPFVTAKYPTTYTISYHAIDGNMTDWKMKYISENEIDMLFKKEGFYKATVTASNDARSEATSTDYHIGIVPDFSPNVYFNIWNNVLTRNEALEITYSADSLDDDIITSNHFKIYFDEDQDGFAEKLVHENSDSSLAYVPNHLGFYKVINVVKETYGQDTIDDFVTERDKKIVTTERVFYVDNLRPLVEVDLDIPEHFQEVDMYIMSDQNLDDLSISKLRENRINYNNDLRLYGVDAQVLYRDLKTYISTQEINTSNYFGGSYPSNTLAYNSNGFTGSLNRYNVSNNSYEDYYTTSESYESCSTVNVFNGYVNCDGGCLNSCHNFNGLACEKSCCDADYSQRESCTTETTTVRHYYTVNRYTGYYKGIASKSVKQPYSNPFRETSDKYVVYVSGSSFNMDDYNALKEMADFKVILIGNSQLRDEVNDELFFIENDGSDINDLIRIAIDRIGSDYPYTSRYLLEVNQPFTMNQIIHDSEGDLITNYGFQYVQEEVFDNKMGIETFSKTTYIEDASAFNDFSANHFSKVGLYKIYALLKDNTGQVNFDKHSNVSEVSVLVHRIPIADYHLDWTYDSDNMLYQTNFVDISYDLDHQYSDSNKGIRDVKAMYRKEGSDVWIYAIPSTLSSGKYEFRYSVKDMENTWSHPKTSVFTLSEIPPPQLLKASLKTVKEDFSLSSIPGSEELILTDIVTRYPYDHEIGYRWLLDNNEMTSYQVIDVTSLNMAGDTLWSDYKFSVPKVFADKAYGLQLIVRDKSDYNNKASKSFDVGVFTPINLVTDSPQMILPGDNTFKCTTSIYVDEVILELYVNQIFSTHVKMTKVGTNEWQYIYPSDDVIGDGDYEFKYTAVYKSNPEKYEEAIDTVEKISLRASSIEIRGAWNYWDGQENIYGDSLSNEPHRFLSLEEISIDVKTIGLPDRIEIEMSPLLKEMTFTDEKDNTYSYKDLVGYEVEFPLTMSSFNKEDWTLKYVLPLAPSTKSFDNQNLTPPYFIRIRLIKGNRFVDYLVEDIHITGNTLDHLYLQPNN